MQQYYSLGWWMGAGWHFPVKYGQAVSNIRYVVMCSTMNPDSWYTSMQEELTRRVKHQCPLIGVNGGHSITEQKHGALEMVQHIAETCEIEAASPQDEDDLCVRGVQGRLTSVMAAGDM